MTGRKVRWWWRPWVGDVPCEESTILFRERQRMPVSAIVLFYLGTVGVVGLFGLLMLTGLFSKAEGEPITWTGFVLVSNGMALFLTTFAAISTRKTIIRLDPLHLHVWWRTDRLSEVVRWEQVRGRELSRWRRDLLRPAGYSAISQATYYAAGGQQNAFCPLWIRRALLIELRGLGQPRHLLLGTNRPEEFEAALADAVRNLPRSVR